MTIENKQDSTISAKNTASVDENASTDENQLYSFEDLVYWASTGQITEEEFFKIADYVRARDKKLARRAAQTRWMREHRRKITKD